MTRHSTAPPNAFVNFSTNGLVFQLSREDQNRLQQICQPLELAEGDQLCPPKASSPAKVYFLTGACVILWVNNPDQARLAVGLIGTEGAVGLGAALGQQASHLQFEVQTAGQAWCADSQELQGLLQAHPTILWAVARYLWLMTHDIANMAATIQGDNIATRLAAWLVLCAQRTQAAQLQLTHDQLARMMGVRRVSVTLAAMAFKEQGLLDYKRGVINILNMEGLVQQARAHAPACMPS
jgi:CRP-like cAMP-binding protein